MVEEDGKPTDKTDTKGTEADKPTEDAPKTTPLIDIANQAAERMEKANLETARLFKQQESRDERVALGGEGGGRAELKLISEQDLKTKNAAEFFKGTQLEKDIIKANEHE